MREVDWNALAFTDDVDCKVEGVSEWFGDSWNDLSETGLTYHQVNEGAHLGWCGGSAFREQGQASSVASFFRRAAEIVSEWEATRSELSDESGEPVQIFAYDEALADMQEVAMWLVEEMAEFSEQMSCREASSTALRNENGPQVEG